MWDFLTYLLQLNCAASEVTQSKIRPVMSSAENHPVDNSRCLKVFVVHPHTFFM